MSSMETILQNKYNIATLYPTEWPAEKDLSSDEDDDDIPQPASTPNLNLRRSKSRYSVLENPGRFQRSLPGAEKTRDGVENLVQKDEPDPLGAYPSVVSILRQRGLPVEDDTKLRNRFLLSSTTFSPSLFLSQVHSSASTDSLLQGLDFLSRSIEKKSASLKILVESNFDRFVRAKATIDNVYNEMRDQGEQPPPSPGQGRHSRHASRSSVSNRNAGGLAPGMAKAVPKDKKKNALVKESEYGVQGIKAPLTEVAVKAEEVWGPALGGHEKEETLKAILASVERNRGLFEIGASLQDAIRRRDYESIVEEFNRARKFTEDAKYIVDQVSLRAAGLSDAEVHQVIVTAKMWADVEAQIESFKRDAWRRLAALHFSKHGPGLHEEEKTEQHMELISVMLELGVEDNPIWIWLLSRYDYLKSRVNSTCERSKVEIEILRRQLANAGKPSMRLLSKHLRAVASQNPLTEAGGGNIGSRLDSAKVVEFWEHVHTTMSALLSTNGGILGEIIEYWEIASSFISGKAQKSLPVGVNNQSAHHHRLSSDGVRDLEKGVTELTNLIREHLYSFFSEPPIEDISLLFSPAPTTPTPTTPRTPLSAALSPRGDTRFRFDKNNIPPPSPSRNETWERYAFWAPYSNGLSGSYYLAKILLLVGTAANEMASVRTPEMGSNARLDDNLRALVGAVRERCVQAVCAAWNTDAENMKVLEDWSRDPESKDTTNLPNRFLAVQSFLLTNLQKIMYVTGSDSGSSSKTSIEVVVPPSTKLLQMARAQFVTTLYRTLSGMVECAEKGRLALGKEWEVKGDDLTIEGPEMGMGIVEDDGSGWGKVDAEKQSTRLLLTLSNMSTFNTSTTPHLLTQFETLFSVQLTDETNRIRDVLSQLDAQLFKSFTKRHVAKLDATVQNGIFNPNWAVSLPGKSTAERDPSPYIFEILLDLVIIHTEVSTTSPSLTPRILKHLFESTATSLITTFNRLPTCSVSALMQATLDVEFLSQTLAAYTTEKASQIQTDIYQVLDQKTDNSSRMQLQDELPALRSVLKRLREATKAEFACFRRVKRGTVGETAR